MSRWKASATCSRTTNRRTRIARALLSGEIRDGATIRIEVAGGDLVVRWGNPDGAGDAERREAVGAVA